ncbi:hypothetical protein H2198_008171 [Neophaeococcomyces mojaviensis]|uniref:Uncharacterized protein n=1 Tax=Neophaeococcomyces mojaviensis TaxID=3383035 RepID=A0ACC2ZY60_9EURO|nr:hypothetical protein H2198_008171 [Knufia sp. JES_112]
MDQYVEDRPTLFREVLTHLETVRNDPSTGLHEELLRRASRNVDTHAPRGTLWQILHQGEQILQTLQQDPRPLTVLLEQVVLSLPFDELKETITSDKLESGLKSPAAAIQLFILAYLRKAADLPSGAAFVACSPSLTQSLVTTWLASESTEVADKSLETIVALLDVDSPSTSTFVVAQSSSGEARGQGLLWRRVFQDPNVYSQLFRWTSLTDSNHDISTKKGQQQVTISQGRLFDFIARLAQIDWSQITTSSLPDVEQHFLKGDSGNQPYGGILRYAASDMIDKSDYLMEVLRQDFFMRLLAVVEENNSRGVTSRLLHAIKSDAGINQNGEPNANGLHL